MTQSWISVIEFIWMQCAHVYKITLHLFFQNALISFSEYFTFLLLLLLWYCCCCSLCSGKVWHWNSPLILLPSLKQRHFIPPANSLPHSPLDPCLIRTSSTAPTDWMPFINSTFTDMFSSIPRFFPCVLRVTFSIFEIHVIFICQLIQTHHIFLQHRLYKICIFLFIFTFCFGFYVYTIYFPTILICLLLLYHCSFIWHNFFFLWFSPSPFTPLSSSNWINQTNQHYNLPILISQLNHIQDQGTPSLSTYILYTITIKKAIIFNIVPLITQFCFFFFPVSPPILPFVITVIVWND